MFIKIANRYHGFISKNMYVVKTAKCIFLNSDYDYTVYIGILVYLPLYFISKYSPGTPSLFITLHEIDCSFEHELPKLSYLSSWV